VDVNLALGHAQTIETGITLDQPSVEAQGLVTLLCQKKTWDVYTYALCMHNRGELE